MTDKEFPVPIEQPKVPKTACIIPWIGMEVNTLGNYRPCCLMEGFIKDEDGNDLMATEVTISEAFQSEWMKTFRQRFLNGEKPAACTKCWKEEDAGRISKRMNSLTRLDYLKEIQDIDWFDLEPKEIHYLDLKLGNICNLQCRICGSWSSSKLIREEISFAAPTQKHSHWAQEFKTRGNWPRQAPEFWEDLKALLPGVLYFEITGGEPFLIQQQFDLLQFAVDEGEAHHIEVHYNTNGTTYPEQAPDIWKHFAKVEIAFSIDDIKERFEHQRKNAVWTEVVANVGRINKLKETMDNIVTQICLTVNVQNVYYLDELCDWGSTQNFDHFYFNILHQDESMNVSHMTPEAKELVINKLTNSEFAPQHRKEIDNIITFILQGESRDGKAFADRMFQFDTSRGENFDVMYPEMSEAMRFKDHIKPEFLCMAPWMHTYLSPQSERRMCCASREPAQNFKQYIDTEAADGQYKPVKLNEHWNSDHMKDVRVRMMKGEQLSECANCDMNPGSAYRDYFWNMFGKQYVVSINATEEDGTFNRWPVSWDYRISNLCNFKCRMCGDMLSSSWETEMKKHNLVDLDNPKNFWMKPEVRNEIETFQKEVAFKELKYAVSNNSVHEIYWVGGEPLMMEEHWEIMNDLKEMGTLRDVYVRYNTNLSNLSFKGVHLYKDLLPKTKNWEICASIDGTEKIGEYIRTGLKWNHWLQNFKDGMAIQKKPNQMRLDLTITLPGLIALRDMFELSKELGVQVLTKSVLAYSPDIAMSPLVLPRHILNTIVDEHLEYMKPLADWKQKSIIDVLEGYKYQLNTHQETWPATWKDGLAKGKGHIETLERIRTQSITMEEIMAMRDDTNKWWQAIVPITEQEYSNKDGDRGQY